MSSSKFLQIARLFLKFEGKYQHLIELIEPFRTLVADLPLSSPIKERTEGVTCIPVQLYTMFNILLLLNHFSSEIYFNLMKETLWTVYNFDLPGNAESPLYDFYIIIIIIKQCDYSFR